LLGDNSVIAVFRRADVALDEAEVHFCVTSWARFPLILSPGEVAKRYTPSPPNCVQHTAAAARTIDGPLYPNPLSASILPTLASLAAMQAGSAPL